MTTLNGDTEMQQKEQPDNKYADTEELWPRGGRGFTLGYVEHINGPDGEEQDGFRPTRYELKELARQWYQTQLSIEIDFFMFGQSGSTEWREEVYADRRLTRIAAVIGNDAVREIVQEVEASEKERLGAKWWQVFVGGDSAEWEKVRMEVHAAYDQATPAEPGDTSRVGSPPL